MDKLLVNYTLWTDSSTKATTYFDSSGRNVGHLKQVYCLYVRPKRLQHKPHCVQRISSIQPTCVMHPLGGKIPCRPVYTLPQYYHWLQLPYSPSPSLCFFIKLNRKPSAKIWLVRSPMTFGDLEKAKYAKIEVVYLSLNFHGHSSSTAMTPLERAYATFSITVILYFTYLALFLRYQ